MLAPDGIDLTTRDRNILLRVLAPFAQCIERVGVFGSRALGTAHPASDIDLILWGDLDDAVLARLWTLFDQSSLAVPVDVVAYRPTLSAAFRRHVDAVAKPLFTREQLREGTNDDRRRSFMPINQSAGYSPLTPPPPRAP